MRFIVLWRNRHKLVDSLDEARCFVGQRGVIGVARFLPVMLDPNARKMSEDKQVARMKVYSELAWVGDWVSRDDLRRDTRIPASRLDQIVQQLIVDGVVERRRIKTSGRSRTELRIKGD